MILSAYEPKTVFSIFEELSKIPRGSGNEKAASDYAANFAREKGFKTVQDKFNNVIIFKPGTAGYEDKSPVILQAHLDMVCEKNADTDFNFLTDPLNLYIDGDFVKARGTTLGADNGIGVAFCLALLEKCENHPPLEIILTTEEETGMDGAENLDMNLLKGKRLINLDSSDEKQFTMGCAAGTTAEYVLPIKREKNDGTTCKISVKGLSGGHSGEDIIKERGNSLKILGQILNAMGEKTKIASICGGMKMNAIPREAEAVITFDSETDASDAKQKMENFCKTLYKRYKVSDPELLIEYEKTSTADTVLTAECRQKLVSSLLLMPSGVSQRSIEIENLVNLSCNLGVAETFDDNIKVLAMIRGAAQFYNTQLEDQIAALAESLGAELTLSQRSPAWPYDPDSALLKTALKVYEPIFKNKPKVTAIHAGLECGLFSEKIQGIDIISFGADVHELHTPNERLSISSTARVWEFVKNLLKEL